jgi:hypothetical protein
MPPAAADFAEDSDGCDARISGAAARLRSESQSAPKGVERDAFRSADTYFGGPPIKEAR